MIDGREALRKTMLNAMRFSGLVPILSPFLSGAGAILMLHRVNDEPETALGLNSHLSVTPIFLDTLLAEMKRMGYRFVSMDEAVDRLATGASQGERFATITLDDAYLDNRTDALPVFEKHETPFTIYVAPALVEGRLGLWWELIEEIVSDRDLLRMETAQGLISVECVTPAAKRAAAKRLEAYLTGEVPESDQFTVLNDIRSRSREKGVRSGSKLMSWDDIRHIADHPLGAIGAHTIHHYNLRRLSDEAAEREIRNCARIIEIETGLVPTHFAYPYGHAGAVGQREVRLAREAGYTSAVTTRHGVLYRNHRAHPHALPRLSVNGRYQRVGHMRTMLSGVTTLANSGRRVVTV